MPNEELEKLFNEDREDHSKVPVFGSSNYVEMRKRDEERRRKVAALMAEDKLSDAEDFYRAAMIFQHGDGIEDAGRSRELALKAAELGHKPARWLAAAALDRSLMYQGKPQKYGTNIVPDGKQHRLWDVEPETTDEERAEWGVPPIEEMLKRANEMKDPQPDLDKAPPWLKDAIERWASQEG